VVRPIVATAVHPGRQIIDALLGVQAVIVCIRDHARVAYQDIALHRDRERAIDDGSAPQQHVIGEIDPALIPLRHDLSLDKQWAPILTSAPAARRSTNPTSFVPLPTPLHWRD